MVKKMLFKFSAYGFLKNLQFFDPFIILFFRANGLSFLEIGTLISIRELSIEVLEIPTGIIADITGKRKSMIFSFTAYILSFIVFYFSGGFFWSYAAAMILFALGESFRTGTHKAIILDYLDKTGQSDKKIEYYGKTRSFSKLGSALSAVIAAIIVFFSGNLNIVFIATIVPYIGGLFLMMSYPKEFDNTHSEKHEGLLKNFIIQTKNSFISIFRIKELGKALLHSSTYEGIFKASKDYLQPIVKTQALMIPILLTLDATKRVSLLIGITYTITYLLSSIASRKSNSYKNLFSSIESSLNTAFIATAVILAAIGLFMTLGLPSAAIILIILFFVFENLRKPVVIGYMSERIEKKQRATILSIDSQLKSFFAMISAPLFGLLADNLKLESVFYSGSLIMIMLFLFLRIKKTR